MKNSRPPIEYIESPAGTSFSPDESRVLDFINRKIAAGNSLREILVFLFREIQRILPCDRIGVSFLEENGERMVLYIVVAGYEDIRLGEGYGAEIERSSLKKIFESGIPRIINDLGAYRDGHPESETTALLLQEGILSSMTCPLEVDGRPVGLLFFSSVKKDAYGERELGLHHAVSERLSQAVEKAYRIEQLSQSINSYMEMLGFVTHELKSPLDSIITMGSTLAAGYVGEIKGPQADYVNRMVNKARYLSDLVSQYLSLAKFEGGEVSLISRKTDFIAEVVNESLDIAAPLIKEKGAALVSDVPASFPEVECDPNLMKIVVTNLLSNAVKYGNSGGEIKISLKEESGSARMSVWNAGPGFSGEQKKKLFRKFSRLDKPELSSRKGTGIGLYNSWRIIRLHGGKIWADSKEGEWAEFTFTIPVSREN